MFTPEQRLGFCDAALKYNDKPIELDDWQEFYVMSADKFSILLKGRQMGYSFAAAVKSLIKLNDPDRKNATIQIVSYCEEDSKEKIRYASQIMRESTKKYLKKVVSETKTSIEFLDRGGKTTSRMIAISCRPPRGRNGSVILDEAAIYGTARARLIYTAALPVISRGGCLELGSTPLGLTGIFSDIYNNREKYPKYVRFTVPWWESSALCIGIDEARAVKVEEMATSDRVKRFGTPTLKDAFASLLLEDFQQEYECVFVDSTSSYIPLELIYANTPGMREGEREYPETDDADGDDGLEIKIARSLPEIMSMYDPEKHGTLYLGYDVGRRRDAAVIYAIGIAGDGKKRSLAEIEFHSTPFEEQLNVLRAIMKGLPVVRCCIDQGGMGEMPTEVITREFGDRAEGIILTSQAKEALAIAVKLGLENREFLLPNSQAFHIQVHSIKRTSTLGGNFRYDAERTDKGHADSFWAWALANHAASGLRRQPNFYEQRARQKSEKALESSKPSKSAAPPLARRQRGKSIDSVLRGLDLAHHR
jgi:phage FluMu gp28-like protein